ETAATNNLELKVLVRTEEHPTYLVAALPLDREDEVLAVMLNVALLTEHIAALQGPDFEQYYSVWIVDGETYLYVPDEADPTFRSSIVVDAPLTTAGLNWILRLYPTRPPLTTSWLPTLILVFG